MSAALETSGGGGGGKKRKCAAAGLGELHDDMLERVLARLPPATFFRLRAVSRRWRAAAESNTFRAACARVPARDPWFLMLSDSDNSTKDHDDEQPHPQTPPPKPVPTRGPAAVVFDSGERAWARWRGAPGRSVPVAAAGGLVLYRDPGSGELTVVNPLTGASRALPPSPAATGALQAIAMYELSTHYRVVLILGDLPDLSVTAFDSSRNVWDDEPVVLTRKPDERAAAATDGLDDDDDDAVYFLSKSGDVVTTSMQRTASRRYACAVASRGGETDGGAVVAYFLSHSGTVVACDLARRAFVELPRIIPAYHEHSIDVVACNGGGAYAVVLSEFLGASSLRVWEFAAGGGAWRQVAAMPPVMSQPFYGAKADVNCVAHGDRVVVCVSGADANACFTCDVTTNRWEELPRCTTTTGSDGEVVTDFVAAVSFEPRMEAAV